MYAKNIKEKMISDPEIQHYLAFLKKLLVFKYWLGMHLL